MANSQGMGRTGWSSWATWSSTISLVFLTVTGLIVTFAPFHAATQWTVVVHTLVGLVTLAPVTWYLLAHWFDYRRYNLSDTVLLGYLGVIALLVCSVSGLVVTWQGLFAAATSATWRNVHLISTFVALASAVPHVLIVYLRLRAKPERETRPAARLAGRSLAATAVGLAAIAALAVAYPGPRYENRFPDDYSLVYGPDRPFAPSLATTSTGGAFDAESLAGSKNCGSAGCHEQIYREWESSAHRYSAMDTLFQGVQKVMAQQNGPESTRYCGGCHDPISLFSGSKDLYAETLTGKLGFDEGISCLVCHGVRQTDLQGNANYVMTQPPSYLWQWREAGAGKEMSDFLIRTYPSEHARLSKRLFKAPEYCAACHKQFIDQEVNRVGWVQLQNQYDNWKASHWFTDGDPAKTIECRECHMPLVTSTDPAAGDDADYNRRPDDGKHRSHRFIAANSMMPAMLKLPGWEEQVELTRKWLAGGVEIPEIRDKWAQGPVVALALDLPERAVPGEPMPIRVVLTANKVGHDFPTGPLDIIQSWVELHVRDDRGNEIFASGRRDEKHFIEPGSFLFKAEPVDQHGNLIDRHNLWEMVGVRYRRALFPGYSDTVQYLVDCPSTLAPSRDSAAPGGLLRGPEVKEFSLRSPAGAASLRVEAILYYRKVDQYLLNFLLGEDSGITSPVIEMTRTAAEVPVVAADRRAARTPEATPEVAPGG